MLNLSPPISIWLKYAISIYNRKMCENVVTRIFSKTQDYLSLLFFFLTKKRIAVGAGQAECRQNSIRSKIGAILFLASLFFFLSRQ